MNCTNCNEPLVPGNNTCPKCGTLNMGFGIEEKTELGDEFIELSDDEISITENMTPPTLEVNNETNNFSNALDISSQENVSTYAPEGVEEVKSPEEIMESRKNENVEFVIPASQKPDEDIEIFDIGDTPSVNETTDTVGEVTDDATILKIGNKKLKISNNKKVPQLVFILGIVICFVLGIVIGSTFFKTNVCVTPNQNYVPNSKKVVADGKNNETNASNYDFKIPKDYIYDKSDDGVLVYDKKGLWRIFIKPVTGLYADLAGAKTSIKESLKEVGLSVNQIKELKVNDSNVLIIETTKGLKNQLVAFMDAKNDYVYFMEIVTSDNKYGHELLTIAEDIAKNAKFNDKQAEVEKITVNDISELVVTAAEAHKSLAK